MTSNEKVVNYKLL